jgi:hypothetical protein
MLTMFLGIIYVNNDDDDDDDDDDGDRGYFFMNICCFCFGIFALGFCVCFCLYEGIPNKFSSIKGRLRFNSFRFVSAKL